MKTQKRWKFIRKGFKSENGNGKFVTDYSVDISLFK